jgi:hypothetical protein
MMLAATLRRRFPGEPGEVLADLAGVELRPVLSQSLTMRLARYMP